MQVTVFNVLASVLILLRIWCKKRPETNSICKSFTERPWKGNVTKHCPAFKQRSNSYNKYDYRNWMSDGTSQNKYEV